MQGIPYELQSGINHKDFGAVTGKLKGEYRKDFFFLRFENLHNVDKLSILMILILETFAKNKTFSF